MLTLAERPDTDTVDRHEFAATGRRDRHQFRFIGAPEDSVEISLRDSTRELKATMEHDLGTRLDWIAVDHWDTDNPHTHIVLRAKDDQGPDLLIARSYLTDALRLCACELSTERLGARTEREIQRSLRRDVSRDAWTGLDRQLGEATARSTSPGPMPSRHGSSTTRQSGVHRGRLSADGGYGKGTLGDAGLWPGP